MFVLYPNALLVLLLGMMLNFIRQSFICCHHYVVAKAQFNTIEVLVAMPMARWEFRMVPCLAGGNASATSLMMMVMRFADVQ